MRHALLIGLGLMLLAAPPALATITLPLMFSDGAVVQRDQPLPVWGWATPGATIEVALDGRRAEATASADGGWRVELPAHAAGGPYLLKVRERGGETTTVHDVFIGDVWLASGQSNMEWPVSQGKDAEREIARAGDQGIRHFKVPRSWSGQPQARLVGGRWQAASPRTVGAFSAVGYFFARELRAKTGVAIGIIDSTWGGSRIEAWTDAAAQGLDAQAVARQALEMQARDQIVEARTRSRLARWPQEEIDTSRWSQADFDDRDWDSIAVPGLWEGGGYDGMDGEAWYRSSFTLTAAEARAGIVLGIGRIDDSDFAWVNGRPVGETRMQYNLPRQYPVPAQALRAGVNQLAVRVLDVGGGGGIHGHAGEVFVQPRGAAKRPLDGRWTFRPARVSVEMIEGKNQFPALLYNQMIHPLQAYPVRGVIWYQGEANAVATDAYRYRDQFAALIEQWRGDRKRPSLPFLWVQLANFISGSDVPGDSAGSGSPWALLRESQSRALSLPATAQVVAIDIGEPDHIHPLDKQEVGRRLALAARRLAYGESLVHSGPVFRAARFDRREALVEFEPSASALAVRGHGDRVHGFELAGADRRFHPARAVIRGDTVVVSSAAVAQPQAVRYAWRDNPRDADLINRDGLPASPFRSDSW